MSEWIVIPNWDGPTGFQHYKDRNPKWIKNYTELMSDEDYLALTLAERGVLHGLWLEYASSRRALPRNTSSLTRRLGQKVTNKQLERLNHAGFIGFSASRPLAKPAQVASPDKEVEKEKEQRPKPLAKHDGQGEETSRGEMRLLGANERYFAQVALMELVKDAREDTWDIVSMLSAQLPVASLHGLKEQLQTREDIESPAAYVVGSLKAQIEERKAVVA